MDSIHSFFRDERGQDMIEYALLLAFVVLMSAALLYSGSNSIHGIWNTTNNNLTKAETNHI